MKKILTSLAFIFSVNVLSAGGGVKLPHVDWSFNGPTGVFDRAAQQRGFQVFQEVCASCHTLKYVKFRHLTGIGLNVDEIKALANEYEYPTLDDEGGESSRTGKPFEGLPIPYANEKEAAATYGKVPPDLSLVGKATVGGPDYIYALLKGYTTPPAGEEVQEGLHYNKYFPGHWIAMAQPLQDGQVDYIDGTEATIEQMSKDVTQFLMWASEPNLEARKQLGMKVMFFLAIFTLLSYVSYRRIAKQVKADAKANGGPWEA